jgi:cytochrome c-type biogenesis protein CcmH/NrfF
MIRPRKSVSLVLLALLGLGMAAPLVAQSTGPVHLGYDPKASTTGHFHIGELGELALALELNLKCNCGSCSLDTHSCQFQMQCGTSPVWSERIRRSLEAGESPEAIQASFVADFGTTVLMSPPPEGFNLVGYLLPAVAIITMGMLIGLGVRRGGAYRPGLAPVTELDDEDAERLRAALQKLDEAEGPDW